MTECSLWNLHNIQQPLQLHVHGYISPLTAPTALLRPGILQRRTRRHRIPAAAWRSMKRFNVRSAISRTGIRNVSAMTNVLLVTLFTVAKDGQMGP
ncbi:hypothetical protein NQZ68_015607 [Dissostichus eleginoides]|nr:hypothetical protein NQZ68_015607 [Dissostichus eleginoides]